MPGTVLAAGGFSNQVPALAPAGRCSVIAARTAAALSGPTDGGDHSTQCSIPGVVQYGN
jgi:hypothetical protein